jgi:ubiquinone/menaquinone biosynthesis C-methylase UbiE
MKVNWGSKKMSNLNLYRLKKDQIRGNLSKYTKKAFNLLPTVKNPHILDVGCGTGVPTIELAILSGGDVIGVDIDEIALDVLQTKLMEMRLNNRVRIIRKSIFTMDFPDECFDIIWSEGSTGVLGFEKSIKLFYRWLKPQGIVVIHDEDKDKARKLELVSKNGYQVLSQFDIPANTWWQEYYSPLQLLIENFRNSYCHDTELLKELDKDQIEISHCKSNSVGMSSFYLIMQKEC